jgi:hypothetical protein
MPAYALLMTDENARIPGLMKTIAIDLDDTLNNFTEILQRSEFVRDETHAVSDEVFQDYLGKLRAGVPDDGGLLSTEFTFFRYKIHYECYRRAQARTDGVSFVRWLKDDGWRIVICTQRDLRRAQDCTRKWLADNDIPFDYLFMAGNKIVFCKLWGIKHLVDNDPFAIAHGEPHGVNVYYPDSGQPRDAQVRQPHGARAFKTFEEIIPWIQG